jgi:hypothetical protein
MCAKTTVGPFAGPRAAMAAPLGQPWAPAGLRGGDTQPWQPALTLGEEEVGGLELDVHIGRPQDGRILEGGQALGLGARVVAAAGAR